MVMPRINLPSKQRTLKETRESMGKEKLPCLYSNGARLLKYALNGCLKPDLTLKNVRRDQQRLLRRVICFNFRMLRDYVDYAERRRACRQLALDQLALDQLTKAPT